MRSTKKTKKCYYSISQLPTWIVAKFRYIRCSDSPNLKCITTGHIVPVELPPHLPTTTYSERVKLAENEAIARYEKMMEEMEELL